jgi:hypothetical protein
MALTLTKQELDFLRDVDRLGREGKTQEQIALALSLPNKWALRERVEKLDCRMARANVVKLRDSDTLLVDLAVVEVAQ